MRRNLRTRTRHSTRTFGSLRGSQSVDANLFHIEYQVKFNLLLLISVLSGCSTIAMQDPMKNADRNTVELDWCVKSTSEMNIVDKTFSKEDNTSAFNHRVDIAIEDIESRLIPKISGADNIAVSKINTCKNRERYEEKTQNLYLEINLSGYGSIKSK